MEQYIAKKRVSAVIELEEKTPAKNDMVEVCFDDQTKEKMPKARFEVIVTPETSDDTVVMNKILARVGAVLFGTLHEYGIKWGEVNQASDAMVKLCENGMEKASDILFGFDKPSIPLIEINNVLVKNHAKQDTNGTASTGGGSDTQNKE